MGSNEITADFFDWRHSAVPIKMGMSYCWFAIGTTMHLTNEPVVIYPELETYTCLCSSTQTTLRAATKAIRNYSGSLTVCPRCQLLGGILGI